MEFTGACRESMPALVFGGAEGRTRGGAAIACGAVDMFGDVSAMRGAAGTGIGGVLIALAAGSIDAEGDGCC